MKDHPSPHASQARRGALMGGRSSTSPRLAAGPCTGAIVLLLPLVVLAACASGGGGQAAGGPSSADGGSDRAQDDLAVEIDRGDGSPVERYTVTCVGQVEGDLPDAEAACAHLDGLDEPFAPIPADATMWGRTGALTS